MKNILKILKTDVMNVVKNPAAIIVILALALLPSLYAWLNIAASWDPYSNTRGVAVAVSSLDEGAEVEGESINIGDEVIKSLAKNEQLGWKFVTREEAINGVKYGDYYGAIIIPEDFSEKLTSITSDDIEKPGIDYYMNEKVNAISPKVTGSGASAVVENIQSNFVKEVNETILVAFNDLGISLDDNYTSIEKMRDAVFEMEEKLPEVESLLITADRDIDLAKDAVGRASERVDQLTDVREDMLDSNDRLRERIQDGNERVQDTLDRIADSLESTQDSVEGVYDTTDRIRNKEGTVDDLIDALERQKDRVDDSKDRLDDLIDFLLETDDRIKEKEKLNKLMDRLEEQRFELIDLEQRLQDQIAELEANGLTDTVTMKAIERLIDSINDTVKQVEDLLQDTVMKALDDRIERAEQLNDTYKDLADWFRLDVDSDGKPVKKNNGPFANYIQADMMPTIDDWQYVFEEPKEESSDEDEELSDEEKEKEKLRAKIPEQAAKMNDELEKYYKGTGKRTGYREMFAELSERILLMKAYNRGIVLSNSKDAPFDQELIKHLEDLRREMAQTIHLPAELLEQVFMTLERIESGAKKEEVLKELRKLESLLDAAPPVDKKYQLVRRIMKQLQKDVEKAIERVEESSPEEWSPFLVEAADQLTAELDEAMTKIRKEIQDAQSKDPEEVTKPEQLLHDGVKKMTDDLKERKDKVQKEIDRLSDYSAENIQLFQEIQDKLRHPEKIIQLYERIAERVEKSIETVESLQDSVQNVMDDIDNIEFFEKEADRIEDLKDSLDDFKESIDKSIARVNDSKTSIGESLDNVDKRVKEMSESLGDSIHRIQTDLKPRYAERFESTYERIDRLDDLANRIGDAVPRMQKTLTKVGDAVDTGREKLDVIDEHFPDAKEAILEIADKIRDFEKEGNLDELIDFLKNDPGRVSDFFASPVNLDEHKLYPIPTYGSAMSPFYTVLAFWVGGLILVSTLKVDIDNKDEYRSYEAYFGRLFTFVAIGIAQAAIVTLGNIYLLDTYVVDRLMFVLLGIFVSVVFITIIYTLVSIFGNTGKVLAIILLVTQIGGSGGTFPIQMAPPFFQEIHRFLPFTHAITLMREAVGGIIWSVVLKNIGFMLAYFFIAIIAGVALKKFFNRSSDKFMARARESKMIM